MSGMGSPAGSDIALDFYEHILILKKFWDDTFEAEGVMEFELPRSKCDADIERYCSIVLQRLLSKDTVRDYIQDRMLCCGSFCSAFPVMPVYMSAAEERTACCCTTRHYTY